MDIKDLKATLKKKLSKNGNEYYVVEIQLTPTYTMKAFPTDAEKELILNLKDNSNVVREDVFEDFK